MRRSLSLSHWKLTTIGQPMAFHELRVITYKYKSFIKPSQEYYYFFFSYFKKFEEHFILYVRVQSPKSEPVSVSAKAKSTRLVIHPSILNVHPPSLVSPDPIPSPPSQPNPLAFPLCILMVYSFVHLCEPVDL